MHDNDETKDIRITTYDRVLRAWQNSKELTLDFKKYSDHIDDDDEALRLLGVIKAARGKPYGDDGFACLSCGINRRTAAIKELIGEDAFASINCSGQRATSTLAEYLRG